MTILVLLRDVSIGAAITAALILLVRLLFGRMLSARAKYYLWLLLALRLILPVTPGSTFSLMNYVPRSGVVLESVETLEEQNTALPQAITPTESIGETPEEEISAAISSPETELIAEAPVRTWDWADVLLLVWIVGAAVLLSVYIILYILTERRMTSMPICEDDETQRVFLHLKQKLRVSDRIKLVSGEAGMLGGLLRPTLVIPVERRGEDAAPILVHELMHYKYKDLLLYLLFRLLTAVYWFNPLVWLCFFVAKQDSENACDERVLESGLVSAEIYAETLYREARSGMSILPRTTFGGSGHSLKRRIRSIARFRRRGKLVIVVAVILALVITACGVTSVAKQEPSISGETQASVEAETDVPRPAEKIDTVIQALQPEYGRFGESYEAHVEAGLLDPSVTEKRIISPICTEYTTTLVRDGEELEAVFVFSCTQFTLETTGRQVLTELFVDIPREIRDEQAWISEQIGESAALFCPPNGIGAYVSRDTVGPNLTPEQRTYVAENALRDAMVETEEAAYDYLDNWNLSAISYRAESRQVYFNSTGIALYLTRSDAFPAEDTEIFDPYDNEDGVITFRETAWGMDVDSVFSVEQLDPDEWCYAPEGKVIRPKPKTTPVPDHPEVTDINYCFNFCGPNLTYGLDLVIVRYDPEQLSYEGLIQARTELIGEPSYSGEDKTVWETAAGYILMLLPDEKALTERLAYSNTAYVYNAGAFLDVEAYMENLQPPNGHFGWTYRQHVEAGLLPEGLTQQPTDGGFAVTSTAELGGYEVGIDYLFGPTLVSDENVLRQAFVHVPKDVAVREWVESFWEPWKDQLMENSSLTFTSPVTLDYLLPEQTQREIIDRINREQDRTDATLSNRSLVGMGYMPESGLWQYNGTGAALYLTLVNGS